jgi:hypothetical protein
MNGTEMLALVAWYAFIAIMIAVFYIISIIIVDAATLTIQANATGQGLCNMTVQADIIGANVSQAINSSSWEIVARGMA